MSEEQGDQTKVVVSIPTGTGSTQEFVNRDLTAEELEAMATNMSRIDEITVSYSRRISGIKFEHEDFFQSQRLSWEHFWRCIPASTMADPKSAVLVRKAFGKAASFRIGQALRAAYINVLWASFDRARNMVENGIVMSGLSKGQKPGQYQGSLWNEVTGLEDQLSFDPFDTRGIRKKG